MVKIKNVSKSFVKGIRVVNDFSTEIYKGEIFGLIGPNGAGKTTIIKMMTGLLKEDSGEIYINNITKYANFIEYKKKFGYVSEEINIYEKLTGIEFLNFVGDIHRLSKNEKQQRLEKYLKFFDLETKISDYIINYSHGMKQKLMIIAAILHEPDLLILDEPFTGLDPLSLIRLKDFIQEYKSKGKVVIVCTHLLDIAEKICDRVCIINKGKTLYYGDLNVLKSENKSLEEFFKCSLENESE